MSPSNASGRVRGRPGFVAGVVMMAVSVLVDVVVNRPAEEDVAKLIGVVAWCFCGVWAHEDLVRGPRPYERTSAAA